MSENTLVPIEQRDVKFYDDELTAVRTEDGRVYASLRHMCQALNIDPQGQRQRINRHSVLQKGLMVCKIHTIQGERDTYVLRVDLVPLWLTGIRTSMVKEEIRSKLERFQEEAADVLWEAFQEGRMTDLAFEELLNQDADAVQAYKMAMAVVKLARNQIMLESRIDQHEQTLEDYGHRLETIEADLGQEERFVTETQATQISQAIRAIAYEMTQQTGQNEYGRCWGEFYRKFGVSKYRHLPATKFEDAMAWGMVSNAHRQRHTILV